MMARTESKSMQVHPDDEQGMIEIMQKFHWSLLSSQEIKTVDSHLEGTWSGDGIQSVTKTEHYVKLAFSREIDLPHLKEIKQIENEYFLLPQPKHPKLFPGGIILWLVSAIFAVGLIIWPFYFFLIYKPKNAKANEVLANLLNKREQLLKELEKFEN
jgi:hypothetical protein